MSHSSTAPVSIKQGYDDSEVEYVRKDSIQALPAIAKDPKHGYFPVGRQVLIRTVTMIDVGTLIDVTDTDFILINVSWIADTGRWSDFLHKKIQANEIEPFPKDTIVCISRGAYIEMIEFAGDVKTQK